MASDQHVNLFFESKALAGDTFGVVRFEGEEAISRPFRFEIELVSDQPDIDLAAVLGRPATLSFQRGDDGELRKIHGVLAEFEQGEEGQYGHYLYRAVLVPRLWMLSLSRQNQIYQNMSAVEIVEEELKGAKNKGPAELAAIGLTAQDFEFRLSGDYAKREYVVQYRETDLDFISRLMEHEGVFYFFEHDDEREKIVFCDDNVHVPALNGESKISYTPPSGTSSSNEESVQSLRQSQRQVTGKMILKDYNYRTPTTPLQGEADIDDKGHGLVSEYGNHFKTPEEGQALAKVRAEEILCRKVRFAGKSDRLAFAAGTPFTLDGHYNGAFDQDYLLTRVRHSGTQAFAEATGFAGIDGQASSYGNDFTAIPLNVRFRPARLTPRPKLHGIMNGHVDASGPGTRAEIDAEGRYKLVMPFDLSGQGKGKATRWVRMAQPYGGGQQGMHFPLHKGTEVIWTCIGGDPDRPIITGVAPNPLNRSVIGADSHTKNRIQTASGILIEIEDGPGARGEEPQSGDQQQRQRLAPDAAKPAARRAAAKTSFAPVSTTTQIAARPLTRQQQLATQVSENTGQRDDPATTTDETGQGRYLRLHVPPAALDSAKNNPPQTIDPQDPDYEYLGAQPASHPGDQELPNGKIEAYMRLGANVSRAPGDDATPTDAEANLGWLNLADEPGDALFGQPALERPDPNDPNRKVPGRAHVDGLFDGFIDNTSEGNDENAGNPSRTGEAAKAKFRNGVVWRDHVSGNRLSTTQGDKVEIITGNYRQLICNGAVSTDAANGVLRSGTNVPGNVSMRWVETGDLDQSGAEGYRGQATWGTTEITRNGWSKSDYEGYQEEHFKGHAEETFDGRQNTDFTGTSNESFWGKKHTKGGWMETDLYFGMKLGAFYGIDAQYQGGIEVDLHDALAVEVDNDWRYTFGVEGHFKHSYGNTYEVVAEQDLIAKESIMLQVNPNAHNALLQWARGIFGWKKNEKGDGYDFGGGAAIARMVPLFGMLAGLKGAKDILENAVDTGRMAGNPTLEILKDRIDITVGMKPATASVVQLTESKLVLGYGKNSITIDSAGITLKGMQIKMNPPG